MFRVPITVLMPSSLDYRTTPKGGLSATLLEGGRGCGAEFGPGKVRRPSSALVSAVGSRARHGMGRNWSGRRRAGSPYRWMACVSEMRPVWARVRSRVGRVRSRDASLAKNIGILARYRVPELPKVEKLECG